MLRLLPRTSWPNRLARLVQLPSTLIAALGWTALLVLCSVVDSTTSLAVRVVYSLVACAMYAACVLNASLFMLQEWRGPYAPRALRSVERTLGRVTALVDLVLCNVVTFAALFMLLWVVDTSAERSLYVHWSGGTAPRSPWAAAVLFLGSSACASTAFGFYSVEGIAVLSTAFVLVHGLYSFMVGTLLFVVAIGDLNARRDSLFEAGWRALDGGHDPAISLLDVPGDDDDDDDESKRRTGAPSSQTIPITYESFCQQQLVHRPTAAAHTFAADALLPIDM